MSKILIIDDEVQIRGLLARMMELEGYEVCQAGDCKTALRQLELQMPDVALCDVFLPDGNGVDLVTEMKKKSPGVEIILLTAHGNIPDGVQAIKNGAFDYSPDQSRCRKGTDEYPPGQTGEEDGTDVFVRFHTR